jgi:hypothetical protein
MKVISDPGSFPKRFVLNIGFGAYPENKILSLPKQYIRDQTTSSLDDQALFNEATIELATYNFGGHFAGKNLEMWNSPTPSNIKFKVTTRSRFTHQKREYLKELEKKKTPSKKKKIASKQAEKQEEKKQMDKIKEEKQLEQENKLDEVTDIRDSDLAKLVKSEQSKPVELIIIHEPGELSTSKGAGFKILVNGGKGTLVWR